MSDFNLIYKAFSSRAILIEWPREISETVLKDILNFKYKIQNHYTDFYDISTAYNSLTIYLSKDILSIEKEVNKLNEIYRYGLENTSVKNCVWQIPVCYDKGLAPDLESFLSAKKLTLQQLIDLHAKRLYTVYFLGFLPGFPYLGGLSKELFMPRKLSPDLNIKKGAVGIGGQQTGIYSIDSPGGWHIIGKTPLTLFDVNKNPPCFLKAGDKIIFEPITKSAFDEIIDQVLKSTYTVKMKSYA
jgi:KipI family sensor histidine kinase inhibitor